MTTYYITILLVLIFVYIAQNNIVTVTSNINNERIEKKTSLTNMFYV